MKFIIMFHFIFLSFIANIHAQTPVEVLAESWWTDQETNDNNLCINAAYDLETKILDATLDTSVRVRKSRIDYAIGYSGAFCYVNIYSTPTTSFQKESLEFNQKKCEDKVTEIRKDKTVVWLNYANRVRIGDGTKGCKIQLVKFTKILN